MELVYLWIAEHKNIKNQGFNLNSKWECNYDKDTNDLTVNPRNTQPIDNFFGENISNVTAIVGENGAGKSSLMEFLVTLVSFESGYIYNDFIVIFANGNKLEYKSNINNIKITYPIDKTPDNRKFGIMYYNPLPILEPNFFQSIFISSNRRKAFTLTDKSFYHFFTFDNKLDITLFNHNQMMQKISFLQRKNIFPFKMPSFFKIKINDPLVQFKKYSAVIFDKDINLVYDFVENNIRKIDSKENNTVIKIKGNFLKLMIISLRIKKQHSILELLKKIENSIQDNFADINSMIIHIQNFINKNEYGKINIPLGFLSDINSLFDEYIQGELIFSINNIINSEIEKLYLIAKNQSFINNNITYIFDVFDLDLYSFEWCAENGEAYQLSSGEEYLLAMYSKLFEKDDILSKYHFIIIDEGDLGLHPEWQRQYLKILIDTINSFSNKKIHLILTTHSPFVLSDLPRENVVFLKKGETGLCEVDEKALSEKSQTFASNIHTLFTEGFFMSGTIGEFAKSKIKDVVLALNSTEGLGDNIAKIKKIIDLIGEPIIKSKLEKMLFEKMSKEQKIIELQEQIDKLKNNK